MIIPPEVYEEKLVRLGETTQEMIDQAIGLFSGPSVDLHRWALDARHALALAPEEPPEGLFKAIYAVLPAWGMHRMGASPTRMPDFKTFAASLKSAWPDLQELWTAEFPLTDQQWEHLERAYRSIQARVTIDGSQIVSRSKVLLHLLPGLCAPIDREYTLSFFGVRTTLEYRRRIKPDYEWLLYRELHEKFFHVAPTYERTRRFMGRTGPFDTSAMKIVDNLILANT